MGIVAGSALAPIDVEVHISALHAAARYHGDAWTTHWRVCPARKAGLDCLKCHQLESVANAADNRLDAALEAVS